MKSSKKLQPGKPIVLEGKIAFPKDRQVNYADAKLIAKRPCGKSFVLYRREFFTNGTFEKGIYHRYLVLRPNQTLMPSIHHGFVDFVISTSMNFIEAHPPYNSVSISQSFPLDIDCDLDKVKLPIPHPVAVSIAGMEVKMAKDLFRPGDKITGQLTCPGLKEMSVTLMQHKYINCCCPDHCSDCAYIQWVPAAVLDEQKFGCKSGPIEFSLQVPSEAEMSRDYCYTCFNEKSAEGPGDKFGEEVRFYIKIIGKRNGIRFPPIKIKVPIWVGSPEKSEEIAETEESTEDEPRIPASSPLGFPHRAFQVAPYTWNETDQHFEAAITNATDQVYRGLSVQVWDNLHPRAHATFGFNKLEAGETMIVYVPPNVDQKSLHIIIEDNDYHQVKLGLHAELDIPPENEEIEAEIANDQ
ncbi:MAG TPA: hypothetical protein VKK79_14625 [Candidatus Lokiarchaeia archaeon]|nr:hypothetical protein [Candidatus Lokiarchaeia archaeon]